MVDKKKVAAGIGILAAIGGAALAVRRGEATPDGEGVPQGEVSMDITPQGRSSVPMGDVALKVKLKGRFRDVKGVWGVGATLNVNGLCTAGFPVPTMVVELYDNGVLRKTLTPPAVVIGTNYTLTETMDVSDVGSHDVYGRMVLTNPLGSYEFTSAVQNFDIGEAPPGEVTLDVTLTPA